MHYASVTSTALPKDYARRIKSLRGVRELTQGQLADLIGVSYATVNRWENEQSRPNQLAWRRIIELESEATHRIAEQPVAYDAPEHPPSMDFAADPAAVAAVAEAHRLAYGHLFNPAFATETSLIDPLPHQRIAVYEHMLQQAPLRFLLADDAGAGKTIMTGLYVREMLSRRLIRRVLIVPPAGLVGNWEREMRSLFRLPFRIVGGSDARSGNPFVGPESDLVITSIDTLAGERMFSRLADPATLPYDLVVFDEAHKLSARREPDYRVRKTGRYRLAEAVGGAGADSEGWSLHWSAQHLLLLTATPHMGKDDPYYFLWRLLLPDVLSTSDAFDQFAEESRRKHFIRRTKEEMVRFDGTPLYPQRNCDTLSYDLSQGPGSEQELYDETTDYIRYYYNRARMLNRSAARLAMSVFQRRLASSTYALMRSFERRHEKLQALITQVREGRLSEDQFMRVQSKLDGLDDDFETRTADEDAVVNGDGERHESFEDRALGATVAVSLGELEAERLMVQSLLDKARSRVAGADESKFDKLQEVLRDPRFADDKMIVFTEHRDTAEFLVRRLEGLGFAGRVALIHGGLPYQERDRQVEFFRRSVAEGGASYLVATDAAGEGINLQFCWLMVNYDIPWNPARLEQRMGRIHRYGQEHDPVIIVNLVAGSTREGRVMKTLLDKLEAIRRQLRSDKVFDVVGRLFEGVSVRDYLAQTVAGCRDGDAERLDGRLTEEQVLALEQRERVLYGEGGDVRRRVGDLAGEAEQEQLLRLLPGYVRCFVEKAAPLLDLRVDGDLEETFSLAPRGPGAADAMLPALETYTQPARHRLTVYKPANREQVAWLHPGEPVFDSISATILGRFGDHALRGAVFVDPCATEPYLFHLAVVTVKQNGAVSDGSEHATTERLLESRLIGLRQSSDGTVEESSVERLLLLRGGEDFAPSRVPLAGRARGMMNAATDYAAEEVAEQLAGAYRQRLTADLPSRVEFVNRGFDFQAAELAALRARLTAQARDGVRHAQSELTRVKERQRNLTVTRTRRLAEIHEEADSIRAGDVEFLLHALIVPSEDPEEMERFDAEVEAVAVRVVTAFEEGSGAEVKDVSRPAQARRAGLSDWPGFDLLSIRAAGKRRCIEVKGRAGSGSVEVSDNEWAKACNLRNEYWLYVVYDCATPRPRLLRVQDPFAKLLVGSRKLLAHTVTPSAVLEAAE